MSKVADLRAETVGVRPLRPTLFWDFDDTPLYQIVNFARDYTNGFDVYLSSVARYHLVAPMPSWDRAQELIGKLHKLFPHEHYILNCRRVRLRTAPKFVLVQRPADSFCRRIEVAPRPNLIGCGCVGSHQEHRVGAIEPYTTPLNAREKQIVGDYLAGND